MGGFGGILRGLTTAATGAEQGLANRAELERQARLQLLAQRLQESTIARNNAQATKDLTPKPPPVIKSAKAATTPKPKTPPPLTLNDKRAARQVIAGLREMQRLYAKNPNAAVTPALTAGLHGMGNAPLIGGFLKGFTGPAAQASLDPDQQAFQRAATQVRHHYAMISPHARVSLGLLEDVNRAFVPPAGTDAATIQSSFAPEWQSTIQEVEPLLGGDEMGTGSPTPSATPAPSSIGTTAPTAPSTRPYNPKFWHPK